MFDYIKYNTGLGEKEEKYNKNDRFNKNGEEKRLVFVQKLGRKTSRKNKSVFRSKKQVKKWGCFSKIFFLDFFR